MSSPTDKEYRMSRRPRPTARRTAPLNRWQHPDAGRPPARRATTVAMVLLLAGGPAAALLAGPAWAACTTASGSGLPATGASLWPPVLGVLMVLCALLLVGAARRRSAAAGALLLVAGLVLSGAAVAGSARPAQAQEQCPDTPASGPASAPTTPSTTTVAASRYLVGAAAESINPTQEMIDSGEFYLGGYGLSNGMIAGTVSFMEGRKATGILRDGIHSRALAVSDGRKALVTAQIETQGVFAAYKIGPYGIEDIRRDAAAAAAKARPGGPELGPGQIVVDSNHSHAGPDTAGVWGGVPESYLQLLHDRTVAAIVKAYVSMVPATLSFGTAKGGVNGRDEGALISNQFSNDPANQAVDDELRVLQAKDVAGKVIVTYLNFSAHPTVLGGGNTLVSGDYTGPLSNLLAAAGGVGFAQVGTLGRTQPADRGCLDKTKKDAAASACSLDEYAGRVFARTRQALAAATPLTGKPVVDLHSYLIQDAATNAPIFALSNGGFAVGAPILRQTTPPWFTGNVTGTTTYSGRIGDLLISGSPGEPYPQIPLAVKDATPELRGHFSLGTAGDFLGYLIAPVPEAYPEPIRRSILSGDPPPAGDDCSGLPSPVGCPSPIDNDTYFFNSSMTVGERIICSLLRGADDVLGGESARRDARPQCALFANDLAMAPDADTTFDTGPYRPLG